MYASVFLQRRQHHEHRAPFHLGCLFNLADIRKFFSDLPQVLHTDLRIRDLTTTKTDARQDFLAFHQPTSRIADLEGSVVLGCFRSQPDLFDLDLGLCLASLAFLLRLLVQELSVVEHPAYRRGGIRSYFDQIKFGVLGDFERLRDWNNPNVIAVRANQANLARSYSLIYSVF